MKVRQVDENRFDELVLSSEQPVLLDFYAPWCGPCSLLNPVLDEIAAENPNIRVCKINIDTEHALSSRYKVFRIPTLLVMRDGAEQMRIVGARPKEELVALFG